MTVKTYFWPEFPETRSAVDAQSRGRWGVLGELDRLDRAILLLVLVLVSEDRQGQQEGGALARRAAHVDLPPHGLDDGVADGQAQAGAHAHGLGGEEGIEDALHHLRAHAHPVVLDLHHHLLRSATPRDDAD